MSQVTRAQRRIAIRDALIQDTEDSAYEDLYERSAYFRNALDSLVRVMDDSIFGLAADTRVREARTSITGLVPRPEKDNQ